MSIKKSPETTKWQFHASTVMFEILVPARADPAIICNDDGRQIDLNDEHL
jgi:hypothetical protein